MVRSGLVRALLLALMLLGLAPLAAAETDAGSFLASDGLALPAGATAEGTLEGVVLEEQGADPGWVIHADAATIERREDVFEQLPALGGPGLRHVVQFWNVTNLTVTLTPRAGDSLGFRAEGVGSSRVTAQDEVEVVAGADSTYYGTSYSSSAVYEEEPGGGFFPDDAHVAWRGASRVALTGAVEAKVYGYEARLASNENVTREETGYRAPYSPVPGAAPSLRAGRASHVWLVLHLRGATVDVWAPDVTAVYPAATVDSAGPVSVPRAQGSLATSEGRKTLNGPVTLSGPQRMRLAPEGPHDLPQLRVELASTVRAPSPFAAPPAAVRSVVGAFLAVAVLLVGCAALARRTLLSPEWCAARADAAAERGNDARALRWTRRALRGAPTSTQLRANEGWFLERVGRAEEALAAYRRADDPHAMLLSAGLLARLGREHDADAQLFAALSRAPELLDELDDAMVERALDGAG